MFEQVFNYKKICTGFPRKKTPCKDFYEKQYYDIFQNHFLDSMISCISTSFKSNSKKVTGPAIFAKWLVRNMHLAFLKLLKTVLAVDLTS